MTKNIMTSRAAWQFNSNTHKTIQNQGFKARAQTIASKNRGKR